MMMDSKYLDLSCHHYPVASAYNAAQSVQCGTVASGNNMSRAARSSFPATPHVRDSADWSTAAGTSSFETPFASSTRPSDILSWSRTPQYPDVGLASLLRQELDTPSPTLLNRLQHSACELIRPAHESFDLRDISTADALRPESAPPPRYCSTYGGERLAALEVLLEQADDAYSQKFIDAMLQTAQPPPAADGTAPRKKRTRRGRRGGKNRRRFQQKKAAEESGITLAGESSTPSYGLPAFSPPPMDTSGEDLQDLSELIQDSLLMDILSSDAMTPTTTTSATTTTTTTHLSTLQQQPPHQDTRLPLHHQRPAGTFDGDLQHYHQHQPSQFRWEETKQLLQPDERSPPHEMTAPLDQAATAAELKNWSHALGSLFGLDDLSPPAAAAAEAAVATGCAPTGVSDSSCAGQVSQPMLMLPPRPWSAPGRSPEPPTLLNELRVLRVVAAEMKRVLFQGAASGPDGGSGSSSSSSLRDPSSLLLDREPATATTTTAPLPSLTTTTTRFPPPHHPYHPRHHAPGDSAAAPPARGGVLSTLTPGLMNVGEVAW